MIDASRSPIKLAHGSSTAATDYNQFLPGTTIDFHHSKVRIHYLGKEIAPFRLDT